MSDKFEICEILRDTTLEVSFTDKEIERVINYKVTLEQDNIHKKEAKSTIISNVVYDAQIPEKPEYKEYLCTVLLNKFQKDLSFLGDAGTWIESIYDSKEQIPIPLWYVDLPPHEIKEDAEWVNIESFDTKEEAIAFAKKWYGADDEGKISIISQS